MTDGKAQPARLAADRSPPAGSAEPVARRHWVLLYSRPAAAGLLMLIVLAGIRAAGPAVGSVGPLNGHPLALGVGVEVAMACLIGALAIRGRRTAGGRLGSRLRSYISWAAGLVMTAVIVAEVANLAAHDHYEHLLQGNGHAKPTKPPLPRSARHASSPIDLTYLLYALIAVAVLAAIVVCVAVIRRLKVRESSWYAVEAADDPGEELRKAVESGRTALAELDDARAAIIACYVAMEGSLARAGTARSAAETPDELLARAAAAGLIRGQAAARLTALFYEARFSSHDLPGTAKDDARRALEAISAELSRGARDEPPVSDTPERAAR